MYMDVAVALPIDNRLGACGMSCSLCIDAYDMTTRHDILEPGHIEPSLCNSFRSHLVQNMIKPYGLMYPQQD